MLDIFFKSKEEEINEVKIVNNIRSLGIDMINEAKSGHPGIVLGAAPIIYTLYARHMRFNPEDPNWINRDRFVLSCGHASALLYSTLFMAGYDLTIEDLKQFRQIGSKTPGHPEINITPGVDMSTGPLGQGFASSVGMAIAETYLSSYYQNKKVNLIDHYTYVMCSDGDLMEGISYEAASLAGTLKLNKLIVLYDSNNICLDGSTSLVFNDNITGRFESLNWNVIEVNDGEDVSAIDKAITKAKESTNKPSLIIVKTVIGKFSKNQGTNKVHGNPLSEEDILELKKNIGVREIPFTISEEAITSFKGLISSRNTEYYNNWVKLCEKLDESDKEEFESLKENNACIKVSDIDITIPEDKMESTRVSSGKVLNSISKNNSLLVGGSADLFSSCKNYVDDGGDYSSSNRLGKNIWFGIREHSMGAILNGMALSGIRPYGSTFLSFSDYMKPAIREAAIMNLPTIYLFSHDSIGVGEDGPTHQPIEQLSMLRSIPNLEVFRPADINEVLGTYKTVLSKKNGPSAIILGRNNVPIHETTSVNDVSKGAYIVKDGGSIINGIIIATGEELSLALEVSSKLQEKGLNIRVISMPSIERFEEQEQSYKDELLPVGIKTFVIEAGSSNPWYKYVYNEKYLITINEFGVSGKYKDVYKKFGFDSETVTNKIEELLK